MPQEDKDQALQRANCYVQPRGGMQRQYKAALGVGDYVGKPTNASVDEIGQITRAHQAPLNLVPPTVATLAAGRQQGSETGGHWRKS